MSQTERPLPQDAASAHPGSPHEDVTLADRLSPLLRRAAEGIAAHVWGQDEAIERLLVSVLSGGHALLVGAPGLGKTLLVETAATVLGLSAKRVQFTPDLMASDITGSEILDRDEHGAQSFRFLPGPVFCQMLLADEINRASPRTQSALLQAMQEGRVAQAGVEYALPRPFHVLATQNPIEQEGTYPLPEAQLDRFLLRIPLDFPDASSERAMLIATTGAPRPAPVPLLDQDTLIAAQALLRRLPVGERIVDAILTLVRDLRPESTCDPAVRSSLSYGPGSRAAQALMLATRARALLGGRLSPDLSDVAALAEPVLAHRMALSFTARAEGITLQDLIGARVSALREG